MGILAGFGVLESEGGSGLLGHNFALEVFSQPS